MLLQDLHLVLVVRIQVEKEPFSSPSLECLGQLLQYLHRVLLIFSKSSLTASQWSTSGGPDHPLYSFPKNGHMPLHIAVSKSSSNGSHGERGLDIRKHHLDQRKRKGVLF